MKHKPQAEWHLLVDCPRPGAENMARDQALLDLADRDGVAALRLYRWAPFCVSFGRNEPALERYDRAAIEDQGLDCVRRPTGGRAVWHARELTYAVTAPVVRFGSLRQAYQDIHLMLSRAVSTLGGSASLAHAPAARVGLDQGACFASPAGGEVMVEDAKVIGSAQLRQNGAFLQHGSFLLEDGQDVIGRVTRGQPPASLARPLSAILRRIVTFEDAVAAIRGAATAWSGEWICLEAAVLESLAAGHEARFRSPDWTWRR